MLLVCFVVWQTGSGLIWFVCWSLFSGGDSEDRGMGFLFRLDVGSC